MRKGKEIMTWNEPKDWLRAAKAQAKSDGITTYDLKPWMPVFALIGGLMTFEWSQADPEKTCVRFWRSIGLPDPMLGAIRISARQVGTEFDPDIAAGKRDSTWAEVFPAMDTL